MFSYHHVFHAGSHADVFKHIILHQALLYFHQKETSLFYVDTHAGAGVYTLNSDQAKKVVKQNKVSSDYWVWKIFFRLSGITCSWFAPLIQEDV